MNTLHATDLLDYVIDAVIMTDLDFKISFWNKASTLLFGYEASEVWGQSVLEVLKLGCKHTSTEAAMKTFASTGQWRGEIIAYSKCGQALPVLASVAIVRNKENNPIGIISVNRDISDRVAFEEALTKLNRQLKRSAFYDHLTGLPNRRFLERLFEKQIVSYARKNAWFLACLDLNGFKRVNDSYGHDVGDQLLKKVAKRLKVAIREGDYVARFGGDEFVLLLTAKAKTDVLIMLYRLAHTLEQPMYINGISLKVSACIGIAQMSPLDKSFEGLFRKADAAMYRAKAAKKPVVIYTDNTQFMPEPGYQINASQLLDESKS